MLKLFSFLILINYLTNSKIGAEDASSKEQVSLSKQSNIEVKAENIHDHVFAEDSQKKTTAAYKMNTFFSKIVGWLFSFTSPKNHNQKATAAISTDLQLSRCTENGS